MATPVEFCWCQKVLHKGGQVQCPSPKDDDNDDDDTDDDNDDDNI